MFETDSDTDEKVTRYESGDFCFEKRINVLLRDFLNVIKKGGRELLKIEEIRTEILKLFRDDNICLKI